VLKMLLQCFACVARTHQSRWRTPSKWWLSLLEIGSEHADGVVGREMPSAECVQQLGRPAVSAHPCSYSRFGELYRGFESKQSPTMRQTHAGSGQLFVDYTGNGVPVVIDRLTGEIAVLGASSFTFARARWTQTLSARSTPMCAPST